MKGDADPPDLKTETFQDMFRQKNAGDAVSILRRIEANVVAFRFDKTDRATTTTEHKVAEETKCTILGSKSKRRIRLQSDRLDALYLSADELVHRMKRDVT